MMGRYLCCLLLLMGTSVVCADGVVLPKGVITVAGRQAPALRLSDMDKQPFDLSEHRGQWVFVHFWASWCGPCRREMPAIQRMVSSGGPDNWVVAVINTAESEDTVFNFLAEFAPDITPLMDRDGLATEAWQPRGLPSTYLVDPSGMIRYQILGGRPWDTAPYTTFLRSLASQAAH